jgi:uncharacterized damage-inducible protein DinB
MNAQESLAQQFGVIYQVLATNLEGMTLEHSLAQPSPGGNCANWILGHLTNVQNGVMGLIAEKPVWENEQLQRAGFDPITQSYQAIDWDLLRDRFLGSRERCLAGIARLSDDALEERVPHPFGGTCSRGELLSTLAFHQAYHVGQIAVARRVAGLEGKVKGPGQEQTV